MSCGICILIIWLLYHCLHEGKGLGKFSIAFHFFFLRFLSSIFEVMETSSSILAIKTATFDCFKKCYFLPAHFVLSSCSFSSLDILHPPYIQQHLPSKLLRDEAYKPKRTSHFQATQIHVAEVAKMLTICANFLIIALKFTTGTFTAYSFSYSVNNCCILLGNRSPHKLIVNLQIYRVIIFQKQQQKIIK